MIHSQQQDESGRRVSFNPHRFKHIFIVFLLSLLLFRSPVHYPRPLTIQTKNRTNTISNAITIEKWQDDDEPTMIWRDYDQLKTINLTRTLVLGARIERSRQRQTQAAIQAKVNLIPGRLGQISPSFPAALPKSPHGTPGSEACPIVANNTHGTSSNPPSLSNGGLPGYTGWYRPHSPVLNWYRPIHLGSRPPLVAETTDAFPKYTVPQSKDGKVQYQGTRQGAPMPQHEIVDPTSRQSQSTKILPWTTVVLCPFIECQGNGKDIPSIRSQFYARAYGPSILAGRVTKVPVDLVPARFDDGVNNSQSNHGAMMAYEIAFHFRYPGIYTVEVVLEQGDAWPLSKYPRWNSELSDRDPAYEGWMLPGFPLQVQVRIHHDNPAKSIATVSPTQLSWCTMDQLEESHPADQWLVTGTMTSDGDVGVITSSGRRSPRLGPFEQYQLGYSTLGVCTDFTKESCAILGTKHILWNPSSTAAGPEKEMNHGNILPQCMRHHNNVAKEGNNTTSRPKLNIILIGDSLVRYNTNRLTELLKIGLDPARDVYVTYAAEMHSGVLYGISTIKQTLMELVTRDEHRVVIFNFGLHDIKDACVDHPIESITTIAIPRNAGDCIEFYRKGMNEFLDFIEEYPADLKIFRSTNAGWMRWGQFGFTWMAMNDELAVYSHHSARILNKVAIDLITERRKLGTSSVRILDYYWPTLARPDNTDVDSPQRQSAGSHLVHPGIETMRLLVRLQVMMIMRHFCSEFLDGLSM